MGLSFDIATSTTPAVNMNSELFYLRMSTDLHRHAKRNWSAVPATDNCSGRSALLFASLLAHRFPPGLCIAAQLQGAQETVFCTACHALGDLGPEPIDICVANTLRRGVAVAPGNDCIARGAD